MGWGVKEGITVLHDVAADSEILFWITIFSFKQRRRGCFFMAKCFLGCKQQVEMNRKMVTYRVA